MTNSPARAPSCSVPRSPTFPAPRAAARRVPTLDFAIVLGSVASSTARAPGGWPSSAARSAPPAKSPSSAARRSPCAESPSSAAHSIRRGNRVSRVRFEVADRRRLRRSHWRGRRRRRRRGRACSTGGGASGGSGGGGGGSDGAIGRIGCTGAGGGAGGLANDGIGIAIVAGVDSTIGSPPADALEEVEPIWNLSPLRRATGRRAEPFQMPLLLCRSMMRRPSARRSMRACSARDAGVVQRNRAARVAANRAFVRNAQPPARPPAIGAGDDAEGDVLREVLTTSIVENCLELSQKSLVADQGIRYGPRRLSCRRACRAGRSCPAPSR